MSKLPTVAIIGRPNTGKSTLFNRIVGKRKAIVSDVPGTTRDHIACRIEEPELDYLLIDTGGMGGGTEDRTFEDDVHAQSLLALQHADLILFTVNSREDLTSSDFEIVDLLRKECKQHVPVIMVVTKCDNIVECEGNLPQFFSLGITDEIIPVSATHLLGMDNLQRTIVEQLIELKFTKQPKDETDAPRIAFIGKPNVGKSSIINAFMSDPQRKQSPLLVSEVPGTTRDSIDTVVKYHEKEYILIDTAGIKRRKQTDTGIETLSYLRSVRGLEESDVAVIILDASQPICKQDKRITGMAVEEGKGLIILLNKIDLLSTEERAQKMTELAEAFPFCRFAPIVPCSAITKNGLLKIFDLIEMVVTNRSRRISTKDLHTWFREAVYGKPLGSIAASKHLTQAEDIPPTFVLFVKSPKDVHVSQLRTLENGLRQSFGFEGTPIRWITKSSRETTKDVA